jgi:hypothetical protein
MNNFKHVLINKNRGWRGLAEAVVLNEDNNPHLKMTFSFSQDVWNDLILRLTLVLQDNDNIYVVHFDDRDKERLPKPTQQRSVLIKNWLGAVTEVHSYKKSEWQKANGTDWVVIKNFMKNSNRHTTSDWNCIGIRVMPGI